ncbi:SBBP repeat-containing protein [Conexibacter woesei]|uniref:DUF7948 domain-containing protein n=1 Tax=Conexibacter woesei TaxID=191495 RepID=UPI00041C847C|nr:SBBP repeat-containing protein [Conexibacter woesei]
MSLRRAALAAALVAVAAALPATATAAAATARPDLARLPLAFERNDGQAAHGVRFLARAPGYALALTADGSSLALGRRHARLTGRFVNPMASTTVTGSGRPSGHVNYLIGSRRSGWHAGVPAYAGVTYRGVWPGIDVAFHGDRSELEYDYNVAPGADPSRIGQRLTGARSLRIAKNGDLIIGLPGGAVRQRAPVSYQDIDGARVPVASRFVLHGTTVRIALGHYDRSHRLTIDPSLSYATYLGGDYVDYGVAVALDDDGNAYVTGQTWSSGFATDGAYQTTGGAGTKDAFVAKLSSGGDRVEWVTYLGGSGDEEGDALQVDDDGNVYVGGFTKSNNFPTVNPYQAFRSSGDTTSDGFVARLSPDGSRLGWSTYLGGSKDDSVAGLVLDSAGRTIVAGATSSTNFPTAGGGLGSSYRGGSSDGFVVELGTTGSALERGGYLGGADTDSIGAIAIDGSDRVYVAGESVSQDFPTTAGAPQGTHNGTDPDDPNSFAYYASDGTLTRIDGNLGQIGFSTYMGGESSDVFDGVAADDNGNAYVTGSSSSRSFPTTSGAYQPAKADINTYDAVVAKIPTLPGPSGWATYLGGSSHDFGEDVGIDGDGNVYVTGQTYSTTFPVTDDAFDGTRKGDTDGFLSSLSPDGAELDSSTFLGGSDGESANGLAVGSDGDVLVTGVTYSTNFPASSGAAQPASAGSGDAFLFVAPTRRASAVSVTCGTPSITPGRTVTCTATVTDAGDGPSVTPTGTVGFETDDDGIFSARTCDIDGPHASGACGVDYTPTTAGSGRHTITASYRGDGDHAGSSGTAVLIVRPVGGGDPGAGGGRDDDGDDDNNGGGSGGSNSGGGSGTNGSVGGASGGRSGGRDDTRGSGSGASGDDVIDDFGFTSPSFRAADSGPSATAAATPVGTVVTYTLARAARVTFTVQKPAPGRSVKHGKRTTCDKQSKKNRKKKACTRWTNVRGSFTRDGVAGANRFRFTGRMANHKLAPGKYRLVATPSAGGRRLTVAYAAFRVVR